MNDAQIPHFSFPFTIGGSAAVLEQDDIAEIEQNVKVLVLTEQGERLEVPEFGISDPTFRTEIDTDSIAEAAEHWDSRCRVLLDSEIDFVHRMVRNVRLNVEEQ